MKHILTLVTALLLVPLATLATILASSLEAVIVLCSSGKTVLWPKANQQFHIALLFALVGSGSGSIEMKALYAIAPWIS